MRKSSLRLYGPLLAIALVQAVFITVMPSTRPDQGGLQLDAGTDFGGPGGDGPTFDPETGLAIDPETGQLIDPETGQAIDPETGQAIGGGGTGTAGGSGGGTNGGGGGGSGGAQAAGDTSHCVGDRQFDILLVNPRCVPKWPDGADNGGATYQGVTKDKIKIVLFRAAPNPAVDAILASQGLAATEQELKDLYAAAKEFIEKNYETYGRELELIVHEADCPTTPPDVPLCKEDAREVIKMKPFLVLWQTPLYAEVFDEFARAGILSAGGWHFDVSYFNDRRPFRYDVFMDGTQSADHIAEYYCKKLANGTAKNAGTTIHPTMPQGRNTPRRLGISVPEIPANVRTAERVRSLVAKCDKQVPVISTYESNIETAQEQTDTTVQRYIENKVTTVVCMCDPIAPVFLTEGMSRAGYFPEHLMPGLGLLDYDVLGRLYHPPQWSHAFGPSHLQDPIAFAQQDQSRMWKSTGRSGQTCGSCGLPWAYMSLTAQIIHNSGPNLNPLTVEQAMLSQPPSYTGRPGTVGLELGPKDYTAISDVKEVYWNASTRSKIDGKAGAYVALNNAKRYKLGTWSNGLQVPPKSG